MANENIIVLYIEKHITKELNVYSKWMNFTKIIVKFRKIIFVFLKLN